MLSEVRAEVSSWMFCGNLYDVFIESCSSPVQIGMLGRLKTILKKKTLKLNWSMFADSTQLSLYHEQLNY